MEVIDKIVFGDNQFFGINHMSDEKAQQLTEKFYNIQNIYKVYDYAFEAGIEAIMLNSNNRAKEICTYFTNNRSKYGHIRWYPSIPYPHKYANMVAEKGILPTINEVILKGNTTLGVFKIVSKGATAVWTKDLIKIMQMLIDTELKMFKGLNVKVIFLQNVITDLLLGFGLKEVFYEYCEYIRRKYNAIPGFITLNLPHLYNLLNEWGIKEVAICTSFNKKGFTMSPNVESYIATTNANNPSDYQIMAMSTLASGAIPVQESYGFINKQKVQSVVFGASSKIHIEETVTLIKI
jgi:hypothetical protein